jgi:hypothetical protein
MSGFFHTLTPAGTDMSVSGGSKWLMFHTKMSISNPIGKTQWFLRYKPMN